MTTWNLFTRFGRRARASRANERAQAFDGSGQKDRAIAEYVRAARIDPDWSVPEYNLGLLYKYTGEWKLSLEHNLRATKLAPEDQAGWWNLGIAATALEQWDVARSAWRGAGIDIPDGEGPVDFPCGLAPIRLNPSNDAEVVWAERMDPARASVRSIPLPDSGFRFADTVLNDGASTGWRKLDDREVPVFNCLELIRPSRFSTWVAQVDLDDPATENSIELLKNLAMDRELAAEDWTSGIQVLCKACSEGRPYSDHEHPPPSVSRSRRVAIAALNSDQSRGLLDDWLAQTDGVTLLEFELALDAAV